MKNERQQLIKQAEGSKDQSGDDKSQPLLLVGPKKLKPANGNKSLEASSHKDVMRYVTRPPSESTKCVNLRFRFKKQPYFYSQDSSIFDPFKPYHCSAVLRHAKGKQIRVNCLIHKC